MNVWGSVCASFCVDILRRSRLTDASGNCRELAGLCNILYDKEPSNILFNWLLLSGSIFRWLEEEKPDSSEVLPVDAVRGKTLDVSCLDSLSVLYFYIVLL